MTEIRTREEIEIMRRPSHIVWQVLELLKVHAQPGVTTLALDEIAASEVTRQNAQAAFKGYRGYPAHICASVNEAVVHGIPNKRPLKDGDILSIDMGVKLDGFYGDGAVTVAIGTVPERVRELISVTEASLYAGIEQAVPGNRLSDISHAIQSYVEARKFSIVHQFVGHGIGRNLHEDPQIPNFGPPHKGIRLREGMVLAIEPMVNMGSPEVYVASDGWTALTSDGKYSAHFEHTVAITSTGSDILTRK